MKRAPHWWTGVPGVVACPRCGCPIQRTAGGTIADGMAAHDSYVHSNKQRSA